jgi:hypothetical protein
VSPFVLDDSEFQQVLGIGLAVLITTPTTLAPKLDYNPMSSARGITTVGVGCLLGRGIAVSDDRAPDYLVVLAGELHRHYSLVQIFPISAATRADERSFLNIAVYPPAKGDRGKMSVSRVERNGHCFLPHDTVAEMWRFYV